MEFTFVVSSVAILKRLLRLLLNNFNLLVGVLLTIFFSKNIFNFPGVYFGAILIRKAAITAKIIFGIHTAINGAMDPFTANVLLNC